MIFAQPALSVECDGTDMLLFLTDAELLERFASGLEDAFAVLVRRHGDLVLGVCRRVLQQSQDAEDAFQAAFLVLARKARSITRRESLASWLYKVAYRIALRARANLVRRKAREGRSRHRLLPVAPTRDDDGLGDLLDEEVRRLPEKYRVPVLLCYLQGRTNEEAARQMRCPTGTVKIRLSRARDLLRKRLVRRGVALSVGALFAAGVSRITAASPPLLAATAHAGARIASGVPWTGAGVSTGAAGMADLALKSMVLARVKVAAAVLLTVILAAWTDGLTHQAVAAAPAPISKPHILPSLETEPSQPQLLAWQSGKQGT